MPISSLSSVLRSTWARIDELIAKNSSNWRMDRLSHVDRNILRVATYELLHRRDVPASYHLAVVLDDVPDGAVVVGNPARVVRIRERLR